MSKLFYKNLSELRERYFGATLDQLAHLSGIERERLAEIEAAAADMSAFEADRLAAVYGIDEELLWRQPVKVNSADAISVLALQAEFQDTPVAVKYAIAQAANAAKDLQVLRTLIDPHRPDPRQAFAKRVTGLALKQAKRGQAAHQVGQHFAQELRKALKMSHAPVPSMHELVRLEFPEIAVLFANLASDQVSGVTFVDAERGPTIVLNLQGKNRNPCVRRFSLAHELYHAVLDSNRQQFLGSLSGYLNAHDLEREQKANAFAARFLCPLPVLQEAMASGNPLMAAEVVIGKYGLHYQAMRLSQSVGAVSGGPVDWPEHLPVTALATRWENGEDPGVSSFPLVEVPFERRTLVAEAAATAWTQKLISRDRFARYLGVTPLADVESVVDWLGLDRPSAD